MSFKHYNSKPKSSRYKTSHALSDYKSRAHEEKKRGNAESKSYTSLKLHPILKSFVKRDFQSNAPTIPQEVANVARGILPDMIYHIRIGATTTITTTGVSGTINSYQDWSDLLGLANDWTSIANIFDAIVVDGLTVDLVPSSSAFNVAAPGPTTFVFDDDDGYNPGSLASQIAYHNCCVVNPAIQGATLATEANSTGFKPIHLEYKRSSRPSDRDEVLDAASAGWVKTSDISVLTGSFIFFNPSVSSSSGVTAYTGFYQFDCRLRFTR